MQVFQKAVPELNAQEAYSLWDALKTRYEAIELIQISQNFIHDVDFKFLVKNVFMETMQKQANQIEKKMSEFQLPLPKRSPKSVNTIGNTEAFEDRFLAGLLMTILQGNIGLHLRAFRNSLVNDDIRRMFEKLLKQEVDIYDEAIKYVKLKGWIGTAPGYPSPEGQKQQLDSGEVYHIWDHLSSRYDGLELTMIYRDFTHDPDLKAILSLGIRSLEKQIKVLEQEMDRFGLPLPQRPPESVNSGDSPVSITDELMFRQIFTGMQYMIDLHAVALKQNTTNDRLRTMFLDFLYQELDLLDNWIKYGKIKGWIRPTPMYKKQQ